MIKLLPLSLFVLLSSVLLSQNILPLGQWRSHLPYKEGKMVTQSSSTIYYSTGWSVLLLDKTELSTERLSKVEGLSNVGISLVEFNEATETLIVVYDNSVIDLVEESAEGRDIITLSQIANFNNFVGEKVIFNIDLAADGNSMYLAANYGVSQIDLSKNEFVFTTFTGVDVLDVQVFDGNIYAATEEGIYRAPLNNVNLDDFGNWQLLGEDEGFPVEYSSSTMEVFNGTLYLGIDNDIYTYQNGQLALFYQRPGNTLDFLKATGLHLFAAYPICTSDGCSGGNLVYFEASGAVNEIPRACFASVNAVVEDEQGRIWLGDEARDFRYLEGTSATECTFLSFNSPFSIENKEMTVANNQLWLAAGGVDQRFSARFIDHGFASLIEGNWSIYNRRNREELKGENPADNARGDDLFDFITVAVHPDNGKIFAGSYTEGLIEFDPETDEMILYNENNSTLETAAGDITRSRISSIAFDDENNLWVANHTARNGAPLSVLTNEGFWRNFSFTGSCADTDVRQIDVDLNGYKWIVMGSDQSGILVYDEADLDNPNDDRCRIFSANNSNLPTNSTNCLAIDLDGDIWVGTTEGIIIFECGASAFEPECQGSRRIVEQDGFNAFLLDTEDVQAIAVDGANRKWVGTRNGVFLLSASGEEQILRFEVSNSPLFDNNIIDIAVNDQTGEVFIGTNKGVLSYQGDATLGGRVNRATVEVFPNPVRPEYDGPIAIRGLARDANVKITDVNGKLVFETTANGGQAVWDGRDYNGRRASSGVY
ncbi:MAG: hypothetical protein AAF798_20725, partial [Bacteroidota bacterium]